MTDPTSPSSAGTGLDLLAPRPGAVLPGARPGARAKGPSGGHTGEEETGFGALLAALVGGAGPHLVPAVPAPVGTGGPDRSGPEPADADAGPTADPQPDPGTDPALDRALGQVFGQPPGQLAIGQMTVGQVTVSPVPGAAPQPPAAAPTATPGLDRSGPGTAAGATGSRDTHLTADPTAKVDGVPGGDLAIPTTAPRAAPPRTGEERHAGSEVAPQAGAPVQAGAVTAPAPGVTHPDPSAPGPARTALPVSQQLYAALEHAVRAGDGQHRLTLRLDPGSLGEVRIQLTARDGVLHVRLVAGHDAAAAIEDGTRDLQRLLASAGAHDVRVTVRDLAPGPAGPATGSGSDRPGGDAPRDQPGGQGSTGGADLAGSGSRGSRDSEPTPEPMPATVGARQPALPEPAPFYPGGTASTGVDLAL